MAINTFILEHLGIGRWSLALGGSLFLHSLLAMGFFLGTFWGFRGADTPQGVYVDVVSTLAASPIPTQASTAISKATRQAPNVVLPKGTAEEPPPSSQSSDSIGNVSSAAAGGEGTVGSPDGIEVSARERYLYELRLFLQSRLLYPPIALSMGQEGTALLRFRIQDDGSFGEIALVESSSFGVLDRAAVQLLQANSGWRPLPESQQGKGGLVVTLPVDYRIQ